jgi:hypothetical protein
MPSSTNKESKEKHVAPVVSQKRKRGCNDSVTDPDKYQYVAVDCEFVGVGKHKTSALGMYMNASGINCCYLCAELLLLENINAIVVANWMHSFSPNIQ